MKFDLGEKSWSAHGTGDFVGFSLHQEVITQHFPEVKQWVELEKNVETFS